MTNKNKLNKALYDRLDLEDREIIDEYIHKMGIDEVNSFMQRIINYYSERDILEVTEDVDSIITYENSDLLIGSWKSENKKYNLVLNYLNQFLQQINNCSSMFYFISSIIKYFEQHRAIDENNIDKNKIENLYVDMTKDLGRFTFKIQNIQLPFQFYTNRINKNGDIKSRIGVVLDNKIIPPTTHSKAGFGQNSKINTNFLDIKLIKNDQLIDILSCVKKIAYWSPRNAKIHGFDNRCGIIWFDGEKSGNGWRLPNNFDVVSGDKVVISAIYCSDAFSKMFKRFGLKQKIENIVRGK